ncbi:MAG: hypothetical protein EON54_20040 [Alcaligenaceae bacterium]|nr:MAG: hypothetical protein EON54_20040 [Alcaligenaceae bacterium]
MTDTAIVALLVGLATFVIAAEQWRVARAKLRLDLFEKRYALYELLWSYMSGHVQDWEKLNDKFVELQNHLPQFYFLFGDDIGAYASSALSKGIEMQTAKNVIKRGMGTPDSIQGYQFQTSKLYEWFYAEGNGLRLKFKPYLGFEEWTGL